MRTESRNGLLAKVHIAKKALGLDDETYREMLAALTGRRSAGELTARQLCLVIAALRKRGWADVDPRPQARKKPRPRAGCGRLVRKVEAQLAAAGRPWAYAAAMVRRMYAVESLEWATAEQLRGVIAALAKDAGRRAGRKEVRK